LTVEAAVKALVDEGLLRTEDRRGTFVADAVPSDVRQGATGPLGFGSRRRETLQRGAVVGVVTPVLIGAPEREESWHGAHSIVASFERYISEFDGITRIFGYNDNAGNIISQHDATTAAIEAGCDAILVAMHFDVGIAADITPVASKAGIPIVFIGSENLRPPALSVFYDNPGAGYQAADHLMSVGARRIALVAHLRDWWVAARARGARLAVAQPERRGVEFFTYPTDMKLDETVEGSRERGGKLDHIAEGYALGRRFLADGLNVDGVIAANDRCGFGFMQAASELGFEAGRDYAIIGFDNEPNAKFKQLSTMQPPWEAMGREAGRLLISAVTQPSETASQVSLPSILVARMSTKLPRRVE
jgi:DNA-binding LacI/PurR family transcriptional regulator